MHTKQALSYCESNLHVTMLKAATAYANINLHEKMTLHTADVCCAQLNDRRVF